MNTLLLLIAAFSAQEAAPPPANDDYAPGLKAGNFTFYPSFETKAQYDDNLFLEDKDRNHDVLFLVTPGLAVTHESDKLQGLFGFNYTQWYHADASVANRDEHEGRFRLNWKPGNPYFRFGGNYDLAAQPVDAAFANLVEVRMWNGSMTAGYDFGDTRVELDTNYLNLSTPLAVLEFFEYEQWIWTLRGLHRIQDNLFGFVEAGFGHTLFPNGDAAIVKPDNDIYESRIGVVWTINPMVEVSGKAGYQRRDYDTAASAAFVHDYEGAVFEASLKWTPSSIHSVSVILDRYVVESVLSNYTSNYRARVAYTLGLMKGWDLTISGNYSRARESTDAVVETKKNRFGGEVVTHYQFWKGLNGELGTEWRGKRTNDDTGEYDNFRATAGLRYDF